MTKYTWNVSNLYTQTIEGNEDYVVIANYNTTGVYKKYTASLSGTVQFTTADITTFIPYADLTEKLVVVWIKETLGEDGVANIEACIQGQIDSQITPPVSPENTPLPWS